MGRIPDALGFRVQGQRWVGVLGCAGLGFWVVMGWASGFSANDGLGSWVVMGLGSGL